MENLPILPCLYATPSNPLTESRIEEVYERLANRVDRAYLNGDISSAQYEAWFIALDQWEAKMYRAMRENPNVYPQ